MKKILPVLIVIAILGGGYFFFQKITTPGPRYTRKTPSAKLTKYQEEMERILYSTFEPDQSYADMLIKNGNTFDYVKLYKRDLIHPCDCPEKTYQEFQDSLMQQPLSVKTRFVYNDDNLLLESTHLNDGHLTARLNYTRDDHGLIQKIMTNNQDGKFLTWFVYEKDRYYKVTLKDGVPEAYETFLLNDLKQCIRRFSIKSELLSAMDISFSYDQLGRVVKETTKDSELIYEYQHDEDVYTKFKFYSLNPRKLFSINEMTSDNNRQSLVGKTAALAPSFKYIRERDGDCIVRSYVYNENDRLMSTTLESCP
ncbi:hypothetical protein OQX61_08045 [Pedobacter sp. PLR]|uniref:hypothetical protein n=1 Tax=Pedobacter sp. PLR TaxID=2994465 RepID=UPI002247CA26|nr:hypothetical protein [Pedobacter sp. PLR]MCX2451218.1 hypothetical protein [Pedobacter sp. PLR]